MKIWSTHEGLVQNEARSAGKPLVPGTYALSVAAMIGLLCGCPEKKTDAPAAADAASTAAPSANAGPSQFDRHYAGTLGESAAATMHLVRDGEKLSGTYTYVKIGKPIALSGTVAADGRFAMQESVDGKATGEFKGNFGADGALAGTWAMPDGSKSLPFKFAESNAPVPAPTPTPSASTSTSAPAAGKAVEPATKDGFVDFLVKLAKSNGAPVTREEATKDYDGFFASEYSPGSVERKIAFEKKYKFDGFNSNGVSLYVADVNNDGTDDYALTDINSVSSHNQRLVAVYTPQGDKLKSVSLPNAAPLNRAIYHFGAPFLSVDGEGTTMRFLELKMGPGGRPMDLLPGATSRYLWKGTTFKLLDKTGG